VPLMEESYRWYFHQVPLVKGKGRLSHLGLVGTGTVTGSVEVGLASFLHEKSMQNKGSII